MGIIFDDREKPLSGNEHGSLYLFDSELPDSAGSPDPNLLGVDVLAFANDQPSDVDNMHGARALVLFPKSAVFVAGVASALVVMWLAGQFAAAFAGERVASGPLDGELPPLPASPWGTARADVAAVQSTSLLSAEELPLFDGSLVVESNPVGAEVFIDGARVGMTPLVLPYQRQGTRTVRVEARGHEPWTAAVQIVTGRAISIRADLNLARPPAEPVAVEIEPADGTTSLAVTAANPISRN